VSDGAQDEYENKVVRFMLTLESYQDRDGDERWSYDALANDPITEKLTRYQIETLMGGLSEAPCIRS
jgi:hypothetical protein